MDRLWAPWRMAYIENDLDKPHNGCIFCNLPAENDDRKNLICWRAEHCFVILNRYPYNNGHLMVVPFEHTADLTTVSLPVLTEMQQIINQSIIVLRHVLNPHAMNIGMNLGRIAGAGIDEHIHYHIVPRWNGDTNFMPVLTGTKVMSEALDASWQKISDGFNKIAGAK